MFLYKVLETFNLGPSIYQWIQTFYNENMSSVYINGYLSERFSISRGCRQGDPLSPYLFLLCAEILAVMLRQNNHIKGIDIEGNIRKITQYADDTTLFLDGSNESLNSALL